MLPNKNYLFIWICLIEIINSKIRTEERKNFTFLYKLFVCVNILKEFEYLRIALQLSIILPIDKRVEVANYFFEQNECLSYGTF